MTAAALATRAAMRPISCVGYRLVNSATSAMTITQPTGIKQGDVGVLVFRSAGTITTPSGWTQVYPGVYVRAYGANEGSVTITSNTSKTAGGLFVFRGVDPAAPVDVTSTRTSASGTAAPSTPVTATVNGVIVNVLLTGSSGTDLTINCDMGSKIATMTYYDRWAAIAYGPQIHAGETSKTANWSTVSAVGGPIAIMLVLKTAGAQ